MKAINALLFVSFIIMAKTQVEGFEKKKLCTDYMPTGFNGTNNNTAFSLDFCRTTYFDPKIYSKCCFVQLEYGEKRLYHCYALKPDEWADIEKAENALESEYDLKSIDCDSSYLYISLLLLLSLLF